VLPPSPRDPAPRDGRLEAGVALGVVQHLVTRSPTLTWPHVRRAGHARWKRTGCPSFSENVLAPQHDLLALLAAAREQTDGLGRTRSLGSLPGLVSCRRAPGSSCAPSRRPRAGPRRAARGRRPRRRRATARSGSSCRERAHGRDPAQRLERVGHARHAAASLRKTPPLKSTASGSGTPSPTASPLLRQLLVARDERGRGGASRPRPRHRAGPAPSGPRRGATGARRA
jgi:hypothetical protein